MRKIVLLLLWNAFNIATVFSQADPTTKFIDAFELTIIGKALPTTNPYHGIDTTFYKGMTGSENQQARCSAGLALAFSTNSTYIKLLPVYRWEHRKDNITGIAAAGFDLYIKRKNQCIYAGTAAPSVRNTVFTIVSDMDTTVKECLLYLPIYSEIDELKADIQKDASIKPIPDSFKKKIVFFGSSYTQGVSASRPGTSYPMQIERNLNIQVCNLGFSGNSKLQAYFAEIIAAIDADAIVFDAFSNPDETMIRERLALPDFPNFLVGGRAFSADGVSSASVRVQASVMGLGQAAGAAAALCTRSGVNVSDVDIPLLREVLISYGAILT